METGSGLSVFGPSSAPVSPFILFTLRLVPRYRSRVGILKKRSLWISASAALAAAVALAGCGTEYYFAGRVLPPSGLKNRVLIAIQNPGILGQGSARRSSTLTTTSAAATTATPASFSLSGYGGALPITIQNMPEEQFGAIYGAGDGSFTLVNYAKEKDHRHRQRPQWPFLQHLHYPQQELRLCRQPGRSRLHRREPERRRRLTPSAFPAYTASA